MTTIIEKRERALKLLEASGIWKVNYAPPGLMLLWRLGLDCPPPHLASFWSVFLVCSLYIGFSFGLILAIGSAISGVQSNWVAYRTAAEAGFYFGFVMAAYYWAGRRSYRLPLWKDLDVS